MLAALLLCAMLVMKLRPRGDLARYLHVRLVDRPLAWVRRVERRQLVFAIGLLLLVAMGGELVMTLGSFDLAAAMVWDASVMLDAAVATWTLAAAARARPAAGWVAARLPAMRPRRRARRLHRRPPARAANDDRPALGRRAA